jgi:hypothetical protein
MKTLIIIIFGLIIIWLIVCIIISITHGLTNCSLKSALAKGNIVRYYKLTSKKPKKYALEKEVEITAVDDELFKYTDKDGFPGFDRFEFLKHDYDKVEVCKGNEVIFVCGKTCKNHRV